MEPCLVQGSSEDGHPVVDVEVGVEVVRVGPDVVDECADVGELAFLDLAGHTGAEPRVDERTVAVAAGVPSPSVGVPRVRCEPVGARGHLPEAVPEVAGSDGGHGGKDLAAGREPERVGQACELEARPEGAVGAEAAHVCAIRRFLVHLVEVGGAVVEHRDPRGVDGSLEAFDEHVLGRRQFVEVHPELCGRRPCVDGLLGELGRVGYERDGRDRRVHGEEEGGVDPTGEQERGIVTGDLVETRPERRVDGGEVFVPWPLVGVVGDPGESDLGPCAGHDVDVEAGPILVAFDACSHRQRPVRFAGEVVGSEREVAGRSFGDGECRHDVAVVVGDDDIAAGTHRPEQFVAREQGFPRRHRRAAPRGDAHDEGITVCATEAFPVPAVGQSVEGGTVDAGDAPDEPHRIGAVDAHHPVVGEDRRDLRHRQRSRSRGGCVGSSGSSSRLVRSRPRRRPWA